MTSPGRCRWRRTSSDPAATTSREPGTRIPRDVRWPTPTPTDPRRGGSAAAAHRTTAPGQVPLEPAPSGPGQHGVAVDGRVRSIPSKRPRWCGIQRCRRPPAVARLAYQISSGVDVCAPARTASSDASSAPSSSTSSDGTRRTNAYRSNPDGTRPPTVPELPSRDSNHADALAPDGTVTRSPKMLTPEVSHSPDRAHTRVPSNSDAQSDLPHNAHRDQRTRLPSTPAEQRGQPAVMTLP